MTRTNKPRYLLDTSAVVYHRHGHTLQRAAVAEATKGGTIEVPVFVRMEYLRGVVINLIELHCLIRESVSVEDALIDWAQQIRQERKLKVVLLTISRWLIAQEEWASKDLCMDRLGELLFRLVWSFEETYGPT